MRHPRNVWMNLLGLAAVAALSAATVHAAEPDKYLPGDSDAVISINIRQLLDSPVVKKHAMELIKQGLKQNADAEKFLTAVGLDPFKDLSSVTVSAGGNPESPKLLVIARGNFDLAKIKTAIEAQVKKEPNDLKIHKIDGLDVYEGKDKNTGSPTFAAFLDKETMVASPSKEMVVNAASQKSSKLKPELQELLGKVDQKQSIWLALAVNEEMRKGIRENPQTGQIADKLKALTGSVAVTDGVQAEFQIHTTDEKGAAEVRKMADGIKALVGLLASQNDEIGPLLNEVIEAVKLSTQKTNVSISVKVGPDLIEKGAAKIKK